MESSHVHPTTELNLKLDRIRSLLTERELDAVLISRTDNFAWATCGADAHINLADSLGVASLLITQSDRIVLTNNIEAARLKQEEGLAEQGWEFEISPWFEDDPAVSRLARGLRLGADANAPLAVDLTSEIAGLRSQLTPQEGQHYKTLGQLCAQAMQKAARAVRPGMRESEIAGALAGAVEGLGVQPVVNLIAVDERIFAFRHPLPTDKVLHKYAMLVLCGRKWGLVCSLTRFVHFGPLADDLRRKAQAVAWIDAEMIAATRPGNTLGDVFNRARAAYATVGYPDEWKMHHQGGAAGYAPREITCTPSSNEPILVGQAYAWNPSIRGAKSEDTILVGNGENEILTRMSNWPSMEVELNGQIFERPAILERD